MARPTLAGHRKFSRLVRRLGAKYIARGVLEVLWDGAYEAGDDYLGTADDIETRVAWQGAPGKSLAEGEAAAGVGGVSTQIMCGLRGFLRDFRATRAYRKGAAERCGNTAQPLTERVRFVEDTNERTGPAVGDFTSGVRRDSTAFSEPPTEHGQCAPCLAADAHRPTTQAPVREREWRPIA